MTAPTPLTLAELRRHPLPVVMDGDKDSHGRLLLVAGSRQTPGSAAIAATAAMRAGCGKVRIATVEPMAPHVAMAVPEALVISLPMSGDGGIAAAAIDAVADGIDSYDAVVAGPGMKQGEANTLLADLLFGARLERLVLDAAMLYALSPPAHSAGPAPVLLPHDREMAALIGCTVEEANREPLRCARQCAQRFNALVLMKGPQSHVATPEGFAWKYQGGGPGLGISGSGDTLAGIVGGLLARGADPLNALLWAVWLHGEAGSALGKKVGPVGFLAREISAEVPALLTKAQASFE